MRSFARENELAGGHLVGIRAFGDVILGDFDRVPRRLSLERFERRVRRAASAASTSSIFTVSLCPARVSTTSPAAPAFRTHPTSPYGATSHRPAS